jgi:hypothetical protein
MKSELINARNFMEFFQNQYGIEFIDAITGKRALDLIHKKEQNLCSTCKFAAEGDGKFVHLDDMICTNGESERVTEFVSADSSCDQWMCKAGCDNE